MATGRHPLHGPGQLANVITWPLLRHHANSDETKTLSTEKEVIIMPMELDAIR
jgi:hypothetical protein